MEPLSRPVGPSSPGDRVRAWIVWFGVGRLVASCVATVVVGAGAFWLIRSPAPPTEASLPRATTTVISVPGGSAPGGVPDLAASVTETTPPTTTGPMLVHVAGAVVESGVYTLPAEARIRDAIVAAGGPTAGADANALNLAAPLSDGTRIYVPTVGEESPTPLVSRADTEGTGGGKAPTTAGPVDVNRATVDDLDELPGIGPATATAIVTERERNGPFQVVDDLERVPGIGPAKLDAIRELVTT